MRRLIAVSITYVAACNARLLAASTANAALNSFGVTASRSGQGLTLSLPMQIALGLTLLTLLP
ncbi:MAG: hypothetical protein JO319_13710, partial [Acidobacteriaceae bacterium]|nr:hypothetical protein [Acidobacteriaceae bacterium]